MTEHETEPQETELLEPSAVMSASDFAALGDGQLAYIRPLKGTEAQELFPAVRGLPDGIDLFALLGANGQPLALADSRNGAIANALQNDLQPVSVH